MNPQDFCLWLRGVIDTHKTPSEAVWKIIEDKLNTVNPYMGPPVFGPIKRAPELPGMPNWNLPPVTCMSGGVQPLMEDNDVRN